jgi:hypothetical protein
LKSAVEKKVSFQTMEGSKKCTFFLFLELCTTVCTTVLQRLMLNTVLPMSGTANFGWISWKHFFGGIANLALKLSRKAQIGP